MPEYQPEPVCPHCGDIKFDVSDILTNRPRTGYPCEKCEGDVEVEVHTEFVYTTWPKVTP